MTFSCGCHSCVTLSWLSHLASACLSSLSLSPGNHKAHAGEWYKCLEMVGSSGANCAESQHRGKKVIDCTLWKGGASS